MDKNDESQWGDRQMRIYDRECFAEGSLLWSVPPQCNALVLKSNTKKQQSMEVDVRRDIPHSY